MQYTIEALIQKNRDVVQWYINALDIWADIFRKIDPADEANIEILAKELSNRQLEFEHKCGTRWVGQEIMVITGIAQFYTTNFGFGVGYKEKYDKRKEKATNIYKAFKRSYCSVEVKFHADDIARNYDLEVEKW
jgi:hypothetical protein